MTHYFLAGRRSLSTPGEPRRLLRSGAIGFLLSCLLGVTAMATAEEQQFQMLERDFDNYVLSTTKEAARDKTQMWLQTRIDFIEHSGKLSPAQRKKLELAGRGDTERFFNAYQLTKSTMNFGMLTRDEWQDMWMKIQPLQSKFTAGIHGQDSLFEKTVLGTLNPPHAATLAKLLKRHNNKLFEQYTLAAVAIIEQHAPMTRQQRVEFLRLAARHAVPPDRFGDSHTPLMVVLATLKNIPPKQLSAIFSDDELKVINQYIDAGNNRGDAQAGGFF